MDVKIQEFLRKTIINDVNFLIENKRYYSALVILSQTIETLGAFIDKKPFRAKAQSKKRFNMALKFLFPNTYRRANNNFFLYDKLRNHIAHMLIPSTYINIIEYSNQELNHLCSNNEGVLNISVIEFYNDVVLAVNKLEELIENGEINEKKIKIGFDIN